MSRSNPSRSLGKEVVEERRIIESTDIYALISTVENRMSPDLYIVSRPMPSGIGPIERLSAFERQKEGN